MITISPLVVVKPAISVQGRFQMDVGNSDCLINASAFSDLGLKSHGNFVGFLRRKRVKMKGRIRSITRSNEPEYGVFELYLGFGGIALVINSL